MNTSFVTIDPDKINAILSSPKGKIKIYRGREEGKLHFENRQGRIYFIDEDQMREGYITIQKVIEMITNELDDFIFIRI